MMLKTFVYMVNSLSYTIDLRSKDSTVCMTE